MTDKLDVEVLADGTLKVTSGRVSQANHSGAEAFLRALARACGGVSTRVRRPDAVGHAHDHDHGHAHDHDGVFHVHN